MSGLAGVIGWPALVSSGVQQGLNGRGGNRAGAGADPGAALRVGGHAGGRGRRLTLRPTAAEGVVVLHGGHPARRSGSDLLGVAGPDGGGGDDGPAGGWLAWAARCST